MGIIQVFRSHIGFSGMVAINLILLYPSSKPQCHFLWRAERSCEYSLVSFISYFEPGNKLNIFQSFLPRGRGEVLFSKLIPLALKTPLFFKNCLEERGLAGQSFWDEHVLILPLWEFIVFTILFENHFKKYLEGMRRDKTHVHFAKGGERLKV